MRKQGFPAKYRNQVLNKRCIESLFTSRKRKRRTTAIRRLLVRYIPPQHAREVRARLGRQIPAHHSRLPRPFSRMQPQKGDRIRWFSALGHCAALLEAQLAIFQIAPNLVEA